VSRVVRNIVLLGAFALLALPAAANADPVTDCARDNDLDKHYSNSELHKALDELPTDSDEYGLCREVISGAITSGSDRGGGRPSATGPGGGPVSPDEQAKRTKDNEALANLAGDDGSNPNTPSVRVGDETVKPGSNGLFDTASASNGLPTPLLVALIALGALALTGVLVALRSRIPALGRVPILSKIPAPRAPFPRSSRR
jgi:hypothetical protein